MRIDPARAEAAFVGFDLSLRINAAPVKSFWPLTRYWMRRREWRRRMANKRARA